MGTCDLAEGACRTEADGLPDETVLRRVADEIGVGGELHLLQQPHPVGADGLGAHREGGGDLFDASPRAQQTENLILTVGELFVRQALGTALQIMREFLRQRGAYVLAATYDLADCLD